MPTKSTRRDSRQVNLWATCETSGEAISMIAQNPEAAGSLPPVSPASRSASPAAVLGLTTTAISGAKFYGLLRNSDPIGSFSRMLLASKAFHSQRAKLVWKSDAVKDLKILTVSRNYSSKDKNCNSPNVSTILKTRERRSKHLIFRLSPLMPGIAEEESGLSGVLPTLTTNDVSGGANPVKVTNGRFERDAGTVNHSANLQSVIHGLQEIIPTLLSSEAGHLGRTKTKKNQTKFVSAVINQTIPTLTVADSKNGANPSRLNRKTPELNSVLSTLPTITASDHIGSSVNREKEGRSFDTANLRDAIERGRSTGLKLHPSFAETMMGYETSWTLPDYETILHDAIRMLPKRILNGQSPNSKPITGKAALS